MNEIKLVILNLFLKLFSYLIVAPNVELKKVKSLRNQKKKLKIVAFYILNNSLLKNSRTLLKNK